MNKKKILFVLQSLRMGGAERLQVTVANLLAREGHDVTILIWKPLYHFRENLDPRVRLIYKAPDEHLGNRIPYIRYKFYDDCMWELRASPRQLYRYYVGREKYDVEIAFFHGIAIDIVGGSTNKKALKIAWIHNNMERLVEAKKDRVTALFHRIHNIVCVSSASREKFIEKVGDTGNVRVIYNTLPAEEIRQNGDKAPEEIVPRSPFHIVMVARYHLPKGFQRLIEAVAQLKNEGKDLSLSLVGEGEEEDVIRGFIRENSAEDYIFMVNGEINPYPYIKEADLLVCASFMEGYNLTLAEAMILGTPVLSTDCAGPREVLDGGRYGMLVENSGKGLYSGIKQLYESPELLESYRKKAVERQDFFKEEKFLRQFYALIEGE